MKSYSDIHQDVRTIIITSSLALGGSEKILYNLCNSKIKKNVFVINLSEEQYFSKKLKDSGIGVYNCSLNKKNNLLKKLIKIFFIIREFKPKNIQTWMYHADFLSLIIKIAFPSKNIFWGIRNGSYKLKKQTFILIFILSIFSYLVPNKIISCSNASTMMHIKFGYNKKKIVTINNGVDFHTFRKDQNLRINARSKYALNDKDFIFSMVARWDPQKDHITAIKAFDCLTRNHREKVFLILAGTKIDSTNDILMEEINKRDLQSRIILAGETNLIEDIYNLSDVNILCSKNGEGFPNVISESMACGTPCISTNSGDASKIINEYGWIIEENNPKKLSEAMLLAIHEMKNKDNWIKKSNNSIMHIKSNFSIDGMVDRYCDVWKINF